MIGAFTAAPAPARRVIVDPGFLAYRDRAALWILYRADVATTAQLTTLAYARRQTAQERLSRLYRAGYLERAILPPSTRRRIDDEADVERSPFVATAVDALVALDLVGEDRPAFGAEVAFDREQDRGFADPDYRERIGSQARSPGQPDEWPLRHPRRQADASRRVTRPQKRRENVVGGEPMDDRRDALWGVLVQPFATGRPDHVLQRRPGCPGQGVPVATPRTLAVGRPEAGEQAIVDQACEAPLGDPPMAVREKRRELGRDDIAVDEPDQEAPVAFRQCRPGGDARPRPDADVAGDGQSGPPFDTGRARSARSGSLDPC